MNTSTPSLNVVAAPNFAVRKSFFPLEMNVSFDTAGNVASRYGDAFWDLSSMSTDSTSSKKLYFYGENSPDDSYEKFLIREQHKALVWLFMDAGKTRSWNSILCANLALFACCNAASKRRVDLYSLLSNPDWVLEVAQYMNKVYIAMLSSAIKTLWRHREQLDAPTNISIESLQSILAKEADKRPEERQTPLIPSRVYCAILAALGKRMSVIEQELEALLDAYSQMQDVLPNSQENASANQNYLLRKTALGQVVTNMKEIGYNTRKKHISLRNFVAGRLNEHKITLMLVICAYTGMRVGEVSILPLDDVLIEFEHMGSKHYELQGWTHKLNNGVKRSTTWITSHQGARAVHLARRIAKCIQLNNVEAPKPGQRALLFPSNNNAFKSLSDITFSVAMASLRTDICPIIEPSDIEELDQLELARGWARDDIVVGARWPLAFHQLRRSLAVYAQRSGMVSLPALKSQLQHITQEMASYYADGFSNAVNLVFDKTHFSYEWKAAKAESSYFAYVLGVLFSDEELLGQGVERMANTVETRSRQDTLRLFEDNKLAYRETPLGGCVSTTECKTDPLEPIPYDCLESNCVNLVVFGRRLDHIIKHQEVTVATLTTKEAGSVEHRLEANHLQVLLKAREQLQKGIR